MNRVIAAVTMILVVYIGKKPSKRDTINGNRDLLWEQPGDEQEVPQPEAVKLLKYRDVFVEKGSKLHKAWLDKQDGVDAETDPDPVARVVGGDVAASADAGVGVGVGVDVVAELDKQPWNAVRAAAKELGIELAGIKKAELPALLAELDADQVSALLAKSIELKG